ncbi:lysine-specific demethylase JMJ17-like [Magnolia sinica]|uniref:lysine-specific demethylase JMJ17-like n=1 Tax=Magnolia sinica TaxID=86752 RepID=UPI002658FF39|nr:lysine-specific demethylase JMJ17-like [Magnolia sinica]
MAHQAKLEKVGREAFEIVDEYFGRRGKRSSHQETVQAPPQNRVKKAAGSQNPPYVEALDYNQVAQIHGGVWVDNVRECISQKKPAAIEVDVLDKLKAEMLQLSVQLPEMDMLSVLLSQIELWQVRCNEFLRGPITLKELEVVLQDADNFTVNIPELKLLRQYHSDALSWIHRFHESLVNIQDREDYNLIVEELTSILEAGELLRVHVDQLPHVKAELRKSRCREKAFKTLTIQMPLEFIQELMKEAALLQITKEKLFMDVSRVLEEASSWEESARHLLCSMGQMSEFEDALRFSFTVL